MDLGLGAVWGMGDYEGERAILRMLPLDVAWRGRRLSWKLSMSYLQLSGPYADVGGRAERAVAGLGDTYFTTGWRTWGAQRLWQWRTKLKFPTADQKKGLGSGGVDGEVAALVYQRASTAWLHLEGGRRFRQDPADLGLRDNWRLASGVFYPLTDSLKGGLQYGWRQATTTEAEPARQLTVYLSRHLSRGQKLTLYTVRGFTEATPAWLFGFQWRRPL